MTMSVVEEREDGAGRQEDMSEEDLERDREEMQKLLREIGQGAKETRLVQEQYDLCLR